MNSAPHPGPLPEGEGERLGGRISEGEGFGPRISDQGERLGLRIYDEFGYYLRISDEGAGLRYDLHLSNKATMYLPLPPGEGRGEGQLSKIRPMPLP
jgi:hypothetical protein